MNIAIIGYGKMGEEIEKIALERGHHVPLKINSSNLSALNAENLETIDAAIEFTSPDSAVKNIVTCFDLQVPIVVGTTGWYNSFDEVKQECEAKNATLLHATNCSLGVNIFFKINEELAKLMNKQSNYNVQLEETHHTQKLDAPSGTAITLAKGVLDNLERKSSWKNDTTEIKEELSILSHRIENVPGTHTINYTSEIDDIEIKHTAHNRKGFALGAVVAAEYIHDKKGIFTMNDVLFN
jgi:4-hydroxy-tetrahydrodipicolinate reductase